MAANRLRDQLPEDNLLITRHEDLLMHPRATIEQACEFLGLTPDAKYLDEAASIVQAKPSQTRHQVTWSVEDLQTVRELVARVESHSSYRGEISL